MFVLLSARYFPSGILLLFSLDSNYLLQQMRLFAKMSQREADDKLEVT